MFGKEFYPTPKDFIKKIFDDFNIRKNIKEFYNMSILEPSAGRGDICDCLKEYFWRYSESLDIDCIELDNDLRNVLRGKEYRVIYNDFLKFNTYKHYDLIVMNPPFSEGDLHLSKALSMIKEGGDVLCILNAETIRNPHTNSRKALINKLNELNADIRYYESAFSEADRKTMVEVAVIYVKVENKVYESTFLSQMKKKHYADFTERRDTTALALPNSILNAIVQYNIDIETGIRFIKEYRSLSATLKDSFTSDYTNPIINLSIGKKNEVSVNAFVREVRAKYWKALFENPDFTKQMTSNLQSKYSSKIHELKDYDFNEYNIREIKIDINKNLIRGVEDCIISLFDELSRQYAWYDNSENIHYYNGWQTNKSWIINNRVIMPYNAFKDSYSFTNSKTTKQLDFDYYFSQKLLDIEKVLNYLDDGTTTPINLHNTLRYAKGNGETKKIRLKHFTITVYKKGTCHIEFTNLKALKKLNIFGSQHKGWLPPAYGKKSYNDMSAEEQSVIDEFEGKDSYSKTLIDKEYYLGGAESMLMLPDNKSSNVA